MQCAESAWDVHSRGCAALRARVRTAGWFRVRSLSQHAHAQRCSRGLELSLDPQRDGFGAASWRRRPSAPAATAQPAREALQICSRDVGDAQAAAARLGLVASGGGRQAAVRAETRARVAAPQPLSRRGFAAVQPLFAARRLAAACWPRCCAAQESSKPLQMGPAPRSSAAHARRSPAWKAARRGAGRRDAAVRMARGVPPRLRQA